MIAAVIWFENVHRHEIARVGGKNASLGEMIAALSSRGIEVPTGFATTAEAYWRFIDANGLRAPIVALLRNWESGEASLAETGAAIRKTILAGRWPNDIEEEIIAAYRELSRKLDVGVASVAVRSSATAEDLPTASFAGQQESFLNVVGEGALMDACRRCYASLFTDRAISYRKTNGFDHMKVALSVGVQQMVRSDLGGAGVMFSIETETGFDKVVLINATWGLGEYVVKGVVDPDEYRVFKPLLTDAALAPIIQKRRGTKASKLIYGDSDAPTRGVPTSAEEQASLVLSDEEILTLARWAVAIEEHYGCPMDIEWAKDGRHNRICIVQARPETVQARAAPGLLPTYHLGKKGRLLAKGLAIGNAIAAGPVCLIDRPEDIGEFVDGAILVTTTTDPDWVPVMKRASAIVTDHGGRTSHAAIVSRELGVPAIVGAENATEALRPGTVVTVSCAEGDEGFIYEGRAEFKAETISLAEIPETRTKVMLNLADPQSASRWWRLPADGIGLARMEFVISNAIQVHPMALVHFERLKDRLAQERIAALTAGYPERTDYFVDQLAQGLARLAAVAYPHPIIVRMSDFKTNEYAGLCGGAEFEPQEENPMIGFRGASRYYSPKYRDGFALECRAIKRLRETMGFRNVVVMIPFCRSVAEAEKVLAVMAENGLARGADGLEIYVMCEIPSNVVLATAFARSFDGFSIGSNDLTQLTLGVDRDSADLAPSFNEQDEAVKWMIAKVITDARQAGAKIGLCGQAPSDHPDFAAFLVECGIDSVSVTPDSFVAVKGIVAAAEKAKTGG
ncbi:phosphoenolpyruvate synthase [Sinorhizobium alkalisoli]|uniref:Phosphoenolpyruvate synthase n=1 Tax=Sinorhizobium alkalisoli TaxID=1752398 RepID=A0A1E3V7W5_9HYPH|nr:phosphoenolpyruvate synthase [Sinorhizobium alkalisoli]MCG5478961.1 phosphoenolpyruvate synthase [Sinorhizobium alkalisoli]ODR89537.1 phosphoenolpyruvate synthase [Sinorhizobium alkalisoli]